ncbi:alpha-ketoacid dehydrogenase subunit alpha/beta [Lacibacter sediminis]|uniref:3-methyl-2-oxobutanoate dehydrogenase (2-methylpropanoyl-transferring) n=1 Tax=Lacibacter sediminis TaxID=2760713 RepID=A0A7G5XCV6_9BACT|nr:thiamine pyrophosphate-dependent enzyme [Lacibacter sediminis]QNA43309.1 transketolase [Lacibacter sediminis]
MESTTNETLQLQQLSFEHFQQEVLQDYRIACLSREASLLGRKEVLTGKAKFGIFGDGKEVPQLAMAKFFQPGDFYSGYYRDQTFAFATGVASIKEFFAQLYADPDTAHDPHSAGRQMNSHFASEFVDANGNVLDLVNRKNLTSGMAPTAAQMPRSVGLALASKLFRHSDVLKQFTQLSNKGNEVCFATIGDASTSEGHFWETMNAAAVQQIPLAVFVWDDGYGISVPKKYQTTKGSISEALKGFQKKDGTTGIEIYKVKAWDYAGMCEVFEAGIEKIRATHTPALFHVEEVTQPQGHSTSGSHERYKTADRLQWEREWDCIKKMKEWIIENNLADEEQLSTIERETKEFVRNEKNEAWKEFELPVKEQVTEVVAALQQAAALSHNREEVEQVINELNKLREPNRRDVMSALYKGISVAGVSSAANELYKKLQKENEALFSSHLYHEGAASAMKVPEVKAEYAADASLLNGYEILNRYFDQLFSNNPKAVAFGEDLGFIGDVNQGFAGLQTKHGENRIFDTGIRELTIMGQGIGLAMRGLRPIAEIQYLDYLVYGLQPLTDDVATLQYRTAGRQSAPLIVRSRGHRLEGIWHSGSPMGMIINSLRGMYVCVPRNMVQAAGMYNTLLQSNEPGLVIECLNGYRLKEKMPSNLSSFTVPMGVPEVVRQGTDITIVSYGSILRIIDDAAQQLERFGISCEIIDVQTLLPFDVDHVILESLKKTNRIAFIDEDVPGGAAAYMFNKVMEEQGGYKYLDVAPRTITGKAHRPSYGSDGDYFSKPNVEEIMTVLQEMMRE